MRWRLAKNVGHFRKEIAPIKLKGRKGNFESFEVDEHPREVTMEDLAKLGPAFKKDGASIATLFDDQRMINRFLRHLHRWKLVRDL